MISSSQGVLQILNVTIENSMVDLKYLHLPWPQSINIIAKQE